MIRTQNIVVGPNTLLRKLRIERKTAELKLLRAKRNFLKAQDNLYEVLLAESEAKIARKSNK